MLCKQCYTMRFHWARCTKKGLLPNKTALELSKEWLANNSASLRQAMRDSQEEILDGEDLPYNGSLITKYSSFSFECQKGKGHLKVT
ncbi:hypothetical protein Baya_8876 [Bagarius yarrelli]|uniref:Uncharacterized protein n=1 Tax=Bagarius yarrelli TaxID=175774 RepID=A0A556U9E1_BAGYA|nr:hypothetical protein Baya_8876 [Bagarius yarrelli]